MQCLEVVLDRDQNNANNVNQKFYVALTIGITYYFIIGIINLITRVACDIHIDYNNLPIQHRYCFFTLHLIKEFSLLYGQRRIEIEVKEEDQSQLWLRNPIIIGNLTIEVPLKKNYTLVDKSTQFPSILLLQNSMVYISTTYSYASFRKQDPTNKSKKDLQSQYKQDREATNVP